jgi:hypothetical protein
VCSFSLTRLWTWLSLTPSPRFTRVVWGSQCIELTRVCSAVVCGLVRTLGAVIYRVGGLWGRLEAFLGVEYIPLPFLF